MRCIIAKTGLTVSEIESRCRQAGAKNVKAMPLVKQVACDLDEAQVTRLKDMGLKVKPVERVETSQLVRYPVYTMGFIIGDELDPLRRAFSPALTGTGLTVAVLDSGIRSTHGDLVGKVVYERNFSLSETLSDIFNHGTNIASIIAGDRCGVAPGAALINIKVLNDDGTGTEESVIDGLEAVCELVEEAKIGGLLVYDPEYPNVANISLGAPDDPDPDSPLKLAARIAMEEYQLEVIASAGNSGPEAHTIMCPASEPSVIAVGGMESEQMAIWERSSRGPTLAGEIKPDFVAWCVAIEGASATADDEYVAKTGTSFATPVLSGMRGLMDEAGRARYGLDFQLPWSTVRSFAPFVCTKAPGVPLSKDNDWGYGLPLFADIARSVAKPVVDVTPAIALMGIGMVGMFMIPMAEAWR